jgi:hypothetical protein
MRIMTMIRKRRSGMRQERKKAKEKEMHRGEKEE